jgi:hypothetical protein
MRQSGIYKITNPNGQAYIGQSVNLNQRLRAYKSVHRVKAQNLIYESLKQHGSELHQYDIIKLCKCVDLDKWEAYYKQQFINEHGWDKALFHRIHDPTLHSNHEYLDYIRGNNTKPKSVNIDTETNKVKVPKWVAPQPKYDNVYQYDLDGKFIREYDDDAIWAMEQLPKGKHLKYSILQCARGDTSVAFGYQWDWKRFDSIEPYISNKKNAGVSKYKHLFD